MANPIELPRTPNIPKKDAEDLVVDLSYGALNGLWSPVVEYSDSSLFPVFINYGDEICEAFRQKWIHTSIPSPNLNWLIAYGYLRLAEPQPTELQKVNDSTRYYSLTKSAFDLGERIMSPTNVFISYKHSVSSLLALTLEAYLKLADVDNIFWDKYLQFGNEWHPQLENWVRESSYVICLLGNGTLDSSYVREEIRWAYDSRPNCTLIPFWHGAKPDETSYPEGMSYLGEIHSCQVEVENAEGYESAINRVIALLR